MYTHAVNTRDSIHIINLETPTSEKHPHRVDDSCVFVYNLKKFYGTQFDVLLTTYSLKVVQTLVRNVRVDCRLKILTCMPSFLHAVITTAKGRQ
jgi:hypothetical protein